jgi:hypothetical protein
MKKTILLFTLLISFIIINIQPAYSAFWWRSYELPKELINKTWHQTSSLSKLNDTTCLLIFTDYKVYNLNHTFLLNTKTMKFIEVKTDSFPKSYSNSTAPLTKNKVLWHGGQYDSIPQTWIFDYDSLQWYRIYTKHIPSFRDSVNLTQIYDKKVFQFGICINRENWWLTTYETWIFDYNLRDWYKIDIKNRPYSIEWEGNFSFIDDYKVFYYDGLKLVDPFISESLVADLESLEWYNQKPSNSPIGCRIFAGMDFIDKDIIVLYGGRVLICDTQLDTTFIYDYKQNKWFSNYLIPQPKPGQYKLSNIGKRRVAIITDSLLWVLTYDPKIESVDTMGPQVIETIPKDGEKDVPLGTKIIVKFDKPIDRDYIEKYSIKFDKYWSYKDSIHIIDNYTMQYIPEQKLWNSANYEVVVDSLIMDIFGFHMKQDYTFSFTTRKYVDVEDENQSTSGPELVINENTGTIISFNVRNSTGDECIKLVRIINILGMDVTGNIIETSGYTITIDKNNLIAGLYFITVKFGNDVMVKSFMNN